MNALAKDDNSLLRKHKLEQVIQVIVDQKQVPRDFFFAVSGVALAVWDFNTPVFH